MSFCKACESPLRSEIDRHFGQRESIRAIARYLDENGQPVGRQTLEKHRAHAMPPEITAIETRPPGEKITPIRVSSSDFLEAVVSRGQEIIEQTPEKVKLDHALRAASVLERKKEDGRDKMHVLVLALTGHATPPTIRGTYQQLEGSD